MGLHGVWRRVAAVALVAGVAATLIGCSGEDDASDGGTGGDGSGECTATLAVASSTDLDPDPARPGDLVEVPLGSVLISGSDVSDACRASGGSGGGPVKGIQVSVVQGDTVTAVAQVDGDADGGFGVVVGLPETVEAGDAQVVAEAGEGDDRAELGALDVVFVDG